MRLKHLLPSGFEETRPKTRQSAGYALLATVLSGSVLAISPQTAAAQVDAISITFGSPAAPAARPIDTIGLATAQRFASAITAEQLRRYAYTLASDSLQGRETGTDGQRRAARFLSGEMAALGLPRVGSNFGYEQPIAFEKSSWDRISLYLNGTEHKHLRDFYAFPGDSKTLAASYSEMVVLGYGIDTPGYSDYQDAGDLTGKAVIVLGGEPFGKTGSSLVSGTADTSEWSSNIDLKRAAAERRGAAVLLVVEPEIFKAIAKARARLTEGGMRVVEPSRLGSSRPTINTLYVSPKIYADLVASQRKRVVRARKRARRTGRGVPVELPAQLALDLQPKRFELSGSNVLGYFRGSDPVLAEDLVVVSAHYDHLGARPGAIFYGADDNASGTSAVLTMARALTEATRAGAGPKRSILLLFVSGEEKGLLGSEYYAANPVFPLASTVADINIDMIGRYDEAHADSSAYIYVIGAGRISSDLDAATQAINSAYLNLDLDYTFDAESDPNRFYYRSDHYNFARNGIPSVFFFSGVHEDYHRPSDTPDKLDYVKMEKVARTAFALALNLANRPGELNRN